MRNLIGGLLALGALATGACGTSEQGARNDAGENTASSSGQQMMLSLTRLDCGSAEFKDMNGFFSDRPGVYPPGAGKVTDSCYLIRHGDQQMVWDTGLPAETRDKPMVENGMTAQIDQTLAEQLQQLGIKPEEVDVVGISHTHGDHVGQASQFTNARLVIGKADFERSQGRREDSLKGWRGSGQQVTLASGDVDVFGDGSVVALHLPGHTPGHLALLVRLKSGPVLLTGDLYHSTIARQKRAVPGFNTSREETLQSMDRFQKLAKDTGAKVVIQHAPNDIGLLPTFPQAAQ